MKASKIVILYLFLCFMFGCTDTSISTVKVSEQDCKKNWALCMLFPDSKIVTNDIKPIKIAILDSGINENVNSLNEYVKSSYNAFDNSSETQPLFSHGTMIASIIASTKYKDTMIGINNNTELFDVQVLNEEGRGKVEDTIRGIKWSIEQNVDIINISSGFAKDDPNLRREIKNAHDKGIKIIAATGNTIGLSTDYPAKYPEVYSISAIDRNKKVFSYAGKGKVDFVAPGVNIPVLNIQGELEKQSGTSFATAYATGIISLVLQKDIKNIDEYLKSNAEELGSDDRYGNGLIQIKEDE
ncbi:S8 family peptidase [Peribacillus frigoritolerans]|uniref:S8 family peptidase n=1 Tax=Peribacillus castrilensis TaxID=2897690 RepID=UPI00297003EC|nr:S8 family serine peptidase [Peribacillus castrilensis]